MEGLCGIVATDLNNGIAKNGNLVWNCKYDMQFFKKITFNNIVFMGNNTFKSLNCKPLLNRLNIVLTTNPKLQNKIHNYSNLIFTDDIDFAVKIANNESQIKNEFIKKYNFLNNDATVFIIGGKQIYEKYWNLCSHIWKTTLKKNYDCDLFLQIDNSNFNSTELIIENEEIIIEKFTNSLIPISK